MRSCTFVLMFAIPTILFVQLVNVLNVIIKSIKIILKVILIGYSNKIMKTQQMTIILCLNYQTKLETRWNLILNLNNCDKRDPIRDPNY